MRVTGNAEFHGEVMAWLEANVGPRGTNDNPTVIIVGRGWQMRRHLLPASMSMRERSYDVVIDDTDLRDMFRLRFS